MTGGEIQNIQDNGQGIQDIQDNGWETRNKTNNARNPWLAKGE
jgi:hypothetical protein